MRLDGQVSLEVTKHPAAERRRTRWYPAPRTHIAARTKGVYKLSLDTSIVKD